MKVAVIGASGNVGQEITAELARRGHEVVAIARNPERIAAAPGVTAVGADASDPQALAAAIRGADVAVSALHHDVTAATLLAAVKAAEVPRLLVTGGAASLEVAPGVRLFDTPEFPEAWKGVAQGAIDFLDALRDEREVDWTFLSPAALLEGGPRLGRYRTGGDQLVTDADGVSRISYADYALAMVDELEQPTHSRSRFTVAY